MNIPTWKPNQIDGTFDFSEENLDKALVNVKNFLTEYDGVITLRRSGNTLTFGAILHEREESEEPEILAAQSDSV